MVDHVYCINLEKRPDRRAKASVEFENNGIENVEFFRGTDGLAEAPDGILITKPEYGCSDSHIRIWRDIVDNGYETVLVFEDDVKILPNFNENLKRVLTDLASDPEWDYVNLGPFNWKIPYERITPRLTKGSSLGAHCYLISQRGARKISLWDTKDLRFCQDAQIARSPLKMYYCEEPLANQESFSSNFGAFATVLKGDIGLERTLDWDFIIRETYHLACVLVGVLIIVFYFINRK
jgi:hypothetical protein